MRFNKYFSRTHFHTLCWTVYLGLDGNGFSPGYRCSDFIRVCCVSCCDVPEGLVTEDEENFDSPCRQNWEKRKSMLNAYFTWNTCIGVMEYVNTFLYSRIVLHLAVPLHTSKDHKWRDRGDWDTYTPRHKRSLRDFVNSKCLRNEPISTLHAY
jgi:hypothetical protein